MKRSYAAGTFSRKGLFGLISIKNGSIGRCEYLRSIVNMVVRSKDLTSPVYSITAYKSLDIISVLSCKTKPTVASDNYVVVEMIFVDSIDSPSIVNYHQNIVTPNTGSGVNDGVLLRFKDETSADEFCATVNHILQLLDGV